MRSRTSTKATKKLVADPLDQIGLTPTATSKSDTPIVRVTDQGQLKTMQEIIQAKRAQKTAESALQVAEDGFRDDAEQLYETRCREDEQLYTSIKLVGELETDDATETQSVSFTQTRKCRKMTEALASDPLRSVFQDEFDNLFGPERTIAIDTEVISEKQLRILIEKMMEALGDSFNSAVTVKRWLVPKEAFYRRRILDDKIRKDAARAKDDGFAVPNKAFFKVV